MGNVPRGTIERFVDEPDVLIERLRIYEEEIRKWNPKINLVSPRSLDELWGRHFVDSLQLNPYVPRGTIAALDVGSGGGFPALVLAAANPESRWVLVESDQRKGVFLRRAANAMSLNVQVRSERVETLDHFQADLITARALAELDQLLNWTVPFTHDHTNFLFPKGKTWKAELTQARKNWQMDVQDFPSVTDTNARVLKISKVRKRVKNESNCDS